VHAKGPCFVCLDVYAWGTNIYSTAQAVEDVRSWKWAQPTCAEGEGTPRRAVAVRAGVGAGRRVLSECTEALGGMVAKRQLEARLTIVHVESGAVWPLRGALDASHCLTLRRSHAIRLDEEDGGRCWDPEVRYNTSVLFESLLEEDEDEGGPALGQGQQEGGVRLRVHGFSIEAVRTPSSPSSCPAWPSVELGLGSVLSELDSDSEDECEGEDTGELLLAFYSSLGQSSMGLEAFRTCGSSLRSWSTTSCADE
jgi:hypothetical protein